MVIRHSLQILEQLSEIENIIQKLEAMAQAKGVQLDREMLLSKLIQEQQKKKSPSK